MAHDLNFNEAIPTTESLNIPEVELVYTTGSPETPKHVINNSEKAFQAFTEKWSAGKIQLLVEVKVMFVDAAKNGLGILSVAAGGRTMAGVDARIIFAAAVKCAATGIIICNNHPAGTLAPGIEEKRFAATIKEAGKLLGISLLDYLIICKEGYYSFADDGIL